MSGNYFLRSGTTDQRASSEKGTASSTSVTSKVVKSKTITSSSEGSVDVFSHSLPFFGYSANLTPVYNKMTNKAEPSAPDGSANRQISSSQEAIFDAQNMLSNDVVGVDDMNLDLDIDQAKTHVNTTYKRNRFETTVKNIDDSLHDLENALADQVALEILIEILDETNDLMIPYAKVMAPLLDIPIEDIEEEEIKSFLERHKPRLDDLKARHKTVKNRIQRLSSNESKISTALTQRHGKAPLPTSTVMKMPRITLPTFEDAKTGTIPWNQFKNMVQKLTATMDEQEAIFFLKSNISGQAKRLTASIERYPDAMSILDDVFGNADKVLQTRIADFISLVTQDPNEKNQVQPNRDLWTAIKMFHTYLIQQVAESSSERVLNAILNALIISRLPYNVRQIIIRGRRTFEEQQGNQLSTDDLLEMLNNTIHDLELTQGNTAKPAKKKEEAGKVDQQPHKKRSFVTKRGKDDKKKFCALCNSNEHGTRSHRFPIHGEISLEKVKESLRANKLCAKCAQPIKLNPDCVNGACHNIKRDCFYCGSPSHLNILCDAPRNHMTDGVSGGDHDEKETHPNQD